MSGVETSVFDVLADAVFVVDGDRIMEANEAARRLLGVRELVGRSFEALLAPGEKGRLAMLHTQRAHGWELPATCRVRLLHASGLEVRVDLRFGRKSGLVAITARDITDETRADDLMGSLAQTFARASAFDADAMLDAAEPIFLALGWRVGLSEILPDGSTVRRIIAKPGDPVGDYGRSLVGTHMPFSESPILAGVVKARRALFLDHFPTLEDQKTRIAKALSASMERSQVIRSAWCPIFTNGCLSHLLVVTGRDLTEHDFVPVQLLASQIGAAMHMQLLRAGLLHNERLAAVGEMAAVMAHEVRNPLAVIFNALGTLRKARTGSPELLEIIREEAERLRRLVTDLLDFSRPAVVQTETVDVAEIVGEAIAAARLDPTVAGSTAAIVTDATVAAPVESDPLLLRRALVNLLVNALQYVAPGGRVSVIARTEGRELVVRVHNDGPPMAAEVAARIFEPFFTTRAAGTGLGLAIVQRIVDDLGGRIELDRSPIGTTFSLYVPARGSLVSIGA